MSSYSGALNKIGLHNSVRVATLTVLSAFGMALSLWMQAASPNGDNSLGVLKVVSIRKMTGDEYAKRVTDYIGATHIVRLRFEAPSNRGVYLYAPLSASYCGQPDGYTLERNAGRTKWLAAVPGKDPSKSPGFKRLGTQTGSCWLLMRAGAAYEWETETEPRAPTEEARSVFVKGGKKEAPVEVVSAWYTVRKDSQAPGTTR